MVDRVCVVGASARAACFSLSRAGVAACGVDLFADSDLAAAFPARRITTYPAEFATALPECPAGDWLYVGGLENYPELVGRLAKTRRLLGNGEDVLRGVRDPFAVAACLRDAGIAAPQVRRELDARELDALNLSSRQSDARKLDGRSREGPRWLSKLRKSCGGQRILIVDSLAVAERAAAADRFLQQLAPGESHAACYLAGGGDAKLIGLTIQWVGAEWTGAADFQYAGSCGAITPSPPVFRQLERIGGCLAARFRLQGLFGVDVVIDDQQVWPVEVNPRYTAAVEVLERALGPIAGVLALGRLPPRSCADQRRMGRLTNVVWQGNRLRSNERSRNTGVPVVLRSRKPTAGAPWLADVPHVGERFRRSGPITTVFASGDTVADVRRRLEARIRTIRESLSESSSLPASPSADP